DTFDPSIALKKGTLFPELDLVESNNYNDWLYENPMNRVK
ncbi:MAG: spore coat associated protein CotJA, partial [Peptostreptococcaceae bacterium]|nr:spore coat associated protein CotJA [Peptostreptococcaceae bacterium]